MFNQKRLFIWGTKVAVVVAVLLIGGSVLRASAGPERADPASPSAAPIGTAFSYQGHLTDGGTPANGSYDFRFLLFDAPGGTQVGPIVDADGVAVADGVFSVQLDFGDVFDGSARYLLIQVRPGDSTGSYTVLLPGQELTMTPFSAYASEAPWSGLSGVPSGFSDNSDDDTLSGLGCTTDQIAKWDGANWICADDATGSGDISGVIAGTGLSGGGSSGDVTLDVDFAGSGSADTVARSDHDHGAGMFNMPAAAFADKDGDDTTILFKWERVQDYWYLASTGSSSPPFSTSLDAPVYLPQGAIIDSRTIYVYDADQNNDLQVNFACYRSALDSTTYETFVSNASYSTTGSSSLKQSDTSSFVPYPTIDNTAFSYFCSATLIVDDTGTDLRFYGATLEYHMP